MSKKTAPFAQRAVRLHLVSHDGLLFLIPVARGRDTSRPVKRRDRSARSHRWSVAAACPPTSDTRRCTVSPSVDREGLREPKRRVREVQRSVRPVDQVVRTVQPLAVIRSARIVREPFFSSRVTLRLPCSLMVSRPSRSNVNPFEPGCPYSAMSTPVYPLFVLNTDNPSSSDQR